MAASCCETPSEAGRGVHRWRWVALTHVPQLHQCRTQWTSEPPREPAGSPSRRQMNRRVHRALLCASHTCGPRQAFDLSCPPARLEVTGRFAHSHTASSTAPHDGVVLPEYASAAGSAAQRGCPRASGLCRHSVPWQGRLFPCWRSGPAPTDQARLEGGVRPTGEGSLQHVLLPDSWGPTLAFPNAILHAGGKYFPKPRACRDRCFVPSLQTANPGCGLTAALTRCFSSCPPSAW